MSTTACLRPAAANLLDVSQFRCVTPAACDAAESLAQAASGLGAWLTMTMLHAKELVFSSLLLTSDSSSSGAPLQERHVNNAVDLECLMQQLPDPFLVGTKVTPSLLELWTGAS